jgi:hypothetical protein
MRRGLDFRNRRILIEVLSKVGIGIRLPAENANANQT